VGQNGDRVTTMQATVVKRRSRLTSPKEALLEKVRKGLAAATRLPSSVPDTVFPTIANGYTTLGNPKVGFRAPSPGMKEAEAQDKIIATVRNELPGSSEPNGLCPGCSDPSNVRRKDAGRQWEEDPSM
jgi:hypothetical protein